MIQVLQNFCQRLRLICEEKLRAARGFAEHQVAFDCDPGSFEEMLEHRAEVRRRIRNAAVLCLRRRLHSNIALNGDRHFVRRRLGPVSCGLCLHKLRHKVGAFARLRYQDRGFTRLQRFDPVDQFVGGTRRDFDKCRQGCSRWSDVDGIAVVIESYRAQCRFVRLRTACSRRIDKERFVDYEILHLADSAAMNRARQLIEALVDHARVSVTAHVQVPRRPFTF